jgi:chitin disaccharide deacetylase
MNVCRSRSLLLAALVLAVFSPITFYAQGKSAGGLSGPALLERLGYPANSRLLIIHADDFGMMHSVDTATMEAFENHWITSASIMVPCPWFPEVARWAKEHPEADLGVHVTLNSDWTGYRWPPVSSQPAGSNLVDAEGYMPSRATYVTAHAKISDVELEPRAQIDKAKAAGIRVTHIDAHMATSVMDKELLDLFLSTARAYGVPARIGRTFYLYGLQLDPGTIVLESTVSMKPGVPKSEWMAAYKKMLQPLGPGVHQLVVHLAHDDEEMRGATADHKDWGAEWRQSDFDVVRSAEFQQYIKDQGFVLISWKDLAKALPR